VPDERQVARLFEVVPERYHGALWLGAGAGLPFGEALGVENGSRCLDPAHDELHVVQQLRYSPKEYGGFCLTEPKAGSSGTVDLDPVVGERLPQHVADFPPVAVEISTARAGSRSAAGCRCCSPPCTAIRSPIAPGRPSGSSSGPRPAWPDDPKQGGFHALRHFFATTLITNHVDPKDVQRALRHATLQTTLEIYVHFWPRRGRRRGIVGSILQSAIHRPGTG
jgi:integrase